MAIRVPSFLLTFIKHRRRRPTQNPSSQIRNLTVESKDRDFTDKELNPNQTLDSLDIVKNVCLITRTRSRWEETLLLDFPSVNFANPQFFREFLREQGNVLLSLRFFLWLRSEYGFLPDSDSCKVLFDALVEAKACKVAKEFLDQTSYSPEPGSLEGYIRSLCEDGMFEEAMDVFSISNGIGFCPGMATWNTALSCFLKAGRTDLVWKLYQDMVNLDVVKDADVETFGYLIQAFCYDGEVEKGYGLLRQLLEGGLVPGNIVFNRLIAAFSQKRNFSRVSELLHTMIAVRSAPDIWTYQEVVNGLCKGGKQIEGYRVFNDLKERGYTPDCVMYSTVIHGLCALGWLGEARKVWFDMKDKGFLPNEYTYIAMLHGYFKCRDLGQAEMLYQEMCDKGLGETTVSYNTMISGLCSLGEVSKAHQLFQDMSQKGIARDLITYNAMIAGFCKDGKVVEGKNLLDDLLAQGLQPSSASYAPIIKKMCEMDDIPGATVLLSDMKSRV